MTNTERQIVVNAVNLAWLEYSDIYQRHNRNLEANPGVSTKTPKELFAAWHVYKRLNNLAKKLGIYIQGVEE